MQFVPKKKSAFRNKHFFALILAFVFVASTISIRNGMILPNVLGDEIDNTLVQDTIDSGEKDNNSKGGVSALISSSAAETTAISRSKRMKMYEERYKYKQPTVYHKHAERDEICGNGPNYETFFSRAYTERSVNNEDKTIYDMLFKPGEEDEEDAAIRGNIVEMGAFDGVRESNSRFYEICLGWNTLLIEGNPINWEKLVKNRPHAHRFSYAPSCSEKEEGLNKTVQFDYHPFTNAGLADGSVETAFTGHQKQKKVDVPCGSLTKVLLDIFPGGHVSFFSLDVEGAEAAVLENVDFDRVFVEVFMVEHWNNFCKEECESRDRFRQIMNDNGYILFDNAVRKSDLFIHPLSHKILDTMSKKGFKPAASPNPKVFKVMKLQAVV